MWSLLTDTLQHFATLTNTHISLYSLADLASYLLTNGPRKVYPASRRVRVIHNHTIIVDTSKAMHVWEHDGYPQFYVPLSELRNCSKRDTQLIRSDGVARAAVVEVTIPSRNGIKEAKTDRVLRFTDDKSLGALAGLVRLEFGAMGQSDAASCSFAVSSHTFADRVI